MRIVVLTEKPSVARDIATVLGLKKKADGYLYNEQYCVTWAYGHLVGLAEPQQINPAWKVWRAQDLPMLPESWPLEVMPDTKAQFSVIAKLLNHPDTEQVVCATDAGREGELIFRYIYDKASCQKPVKRLWISSLTPDAIKAGFANLRDWSEFDGLANSAKARSRADWLVGMNLSRGYSIRTGEHFSVGRVQTPTLAMIVAREQEIQSFIPEDYIVIQGVFRQSDSKNYPANLIEPKSSGKASKARSKKIGQDKQGDSTVKVSRAGSAKHFVIGDPEIEQICERVPKAKVSVARLQEKNHRLPPPQFYDLTELQRHANRLFGFSAENTLKIAQSLYEQSKLITYPRTDSRYVPVDVSVGLADLAAGLIDRYNSLLDIEPKWQALGKRYVDNKRVTDHHAILPTGNAASSQRALTREQEQLYDLICRRLIMAYLDDYQYASTEALLVAESRPTGDGKASSIKDHFQAYGRRILHKGWKLLELGQKSTLDLDKDLPSEMQQGAAQQVEKVEALKRRTSPPPRLTDGSLLTAMETAGSVLDDKELSDAMRERGLGTPATRSGIIETLIKRQYIQREKQSLQATEKGMRLIGLVQTEVKSPGMTGEWEHRLNLMRNGQTTFKEFMAGILDFVKRTTMESLKASRPRPDSRAEPTQASQKNLSPTQEIPINQDQVIRKPHELIELLQERFGFSRFRPHQEAICRDVVKGCDTLLVMPTGAGKSLCYQLPGLALGRRTLVISPLIALMDDQVMKLQEIGLAAAAIHSGKSREESRSICVKYASRNLEYLFVAPERLAVPGFIEFLAKHKPTLIAIDEAHCISNWGHDFRYDYRRLTERLAPLRPTVVIAMTATATSRVQEDIIEQLALVKPIRHIRGFRRTNIAIENVELSKTQRTAAVAKALGSTGRLPAIVYAPTRKEAESTARYLSGHFRSAAYHAGMDPDTRSQVQEAFQQDKLEVIVATTAFGMGIDKANVRTVIHLAVPGSLEGYYQEIGRAGRDGKLSRAILLYSYADMKTHEYFLRQNYPDIKELLEVHQAIPKKGIARNQIDIALPAEELDGYLERLVMIGALRSELNGWIFPEKKRSWKKEYEEQKQHRHHQLTEMNRYVNQNSGCRMLRLMAHFGDEDASGDSCGICDICAPENSLLKSMQTLSQTELDLGKKIVERLDQELRPLALGSLFRDLAEPLGWQRRDFDRLLDGLIQQGYCTSHQSSFNKSGEIIHFRTISRNPAAGEIPWSTLQLSRVSVVGEISPKTAKSQRKTNGQSTRQGAVRAIAVDEGLLERLRKWRKLEAEKRKIPAYCILTDRSLQAIASEKPENQQGLLSIHGIGQSKFDQYGPSILAILEKW